MRQVVRPAFPALAFAFAGAVAALLAFAVPPVAAAVPAAPGGLAGIPDLAPTHFTAAFWIERTRQRDRVMMDRDQIAARNVVVHDQPSMHDLASLPILLDRARIDALLSQVSVAPEGPLYDATGDAGSARQVARIVANADLDRVRSTQLVGWGLVVRRTDLRSFPTRLRVFSTPGDGDIDRFQESALFPGTPVAILHESRDRAWVFVLAPDYAAWIEKAHVAIGSREQVLGYASRGDVLLATGTRVETVESPGRPALSRLRLDMGTQLPRLPAWPADRAVDGQLPLAAHVVELPLRAEDGSLSFAPALVPLAEDVAAGFLPYTRGNVLRQAFKFVGERYGWGHAYHGRDCSGFVREVYASFGIDMPRNTGDQARGAGFDRVDLAPADDDGRRRALAATAAGDLLYMPGHVMMVVGHLDGEPWVIHDTAGASVRGADGGLRRLPFNGVVVTPLAPLLGDDGTPWTQRLTAVVRVRAPADPANAQAPR